MQPVALTTERLVITMPTDADVDAITEGAQDPEVHRWVGIPWPYDRAHAEGFVARVPQWWDAENELTWGIRADARWVGMVTLLRVEKGGAAEIGYWMSAPARGRGYLTEAARAVIDFAFDPDGLDLKRVEWRAMAGNVVSARVARTLGFRYEGMLRQGLADMRGRYDGWVAGLLATDDRTPQPWPVLGD